MFQSLRYLKSVETYCEEKNSFKTKQLHNSTYLNELPKYSNLFCKVWQI